MMRRTASAVLGSTFLLAMSAAVTLSQDSATDAGADGSDPYQAFVYEGSCGGLGNEVAVLADVAARGGGDADVPIAASITEVPLALETLMDGHAITIEEPVERTAVACAAVAGALIDGDDGLPVALTGDDDGRVVGVAWIRRLGLEASSVHLFLVDPRGVDAAADVEPTPMPDGSPAPSPSPAGEEVDPTDDPSGIDPDVEIDPGEDIDVDVGNEGS